MATSRKPAAPATYAELIEQLSALSAEYDRIAGAIPAALHPVAALKSQRQTTKDWTDQVGVEIKDMLVKVVESKKAFEPEAPAQPKATTKATTKATPAKAATAKATTTKASTGKASSKAKEPVAA